MPLPTRLTESFGIEHPVLPAQLPRAVASYSYEKAVAAAAWASIIPAGRTATGGDHHLLGHLGTACWRKLMQSYTVRFHIDAPRRKVWRVLHPPAPANGPAAAGSHVADWEHGNPQRGQRSGEGLVRTCVFEVPTYLLTRGRARSWKTVTEAQLNKLSR